MRSVVIILVLLLQAGVASAFEQSPPVPSKVVLPSITEALSHLGVEDRIVTCPDGSLAFAQRGCCSWHGGVCGCYGWRVVCCDGTLSPTCTCNQPDHFEGL